MLLPAQRASQSAVSLLAAGTFERLFGQTFKTCNPAPYGAISDLRRHCAAAKSSLWCFAASSWSFCSRSPSEVVEGRPSDTVAVFSGAETAWLAHKEHGEPILNAIHCMYSNCGRNGTNSVPRSFVIHLTGCDIQRRPRAQSILIGGDSGCIRV